MFSELLQSAFTVSTWLLWLVLVVVDLVQQLLSMFEDDEFPEDGLSSESEEDGLDLSDPDAGAYTTTEGEDMDDSTNGISDNANEVGSSMDDLIPSEADSVSSTEESPLPKRYVKLSLNPFILSLLSNQYLFIIQCTK